MPISPLMQNAPKIHEAMSDSESRPEVAPHFARTRERKDRFF
jgi:hypothetical protein